MGEGVLKKAVAVSLTPTMVHRLWDPVMATSYLVFCCQTCSQPLRCEHAQQEDLHRQCCLGKRMLFMGTERVFSSILITCRPSPSAFHQAHGSWGPVQPLTATIPAQGWVFYGRQTHVFIVRFLIFMFSPPPPKVTFASFSVQSEVGKSALTLQDSTL